jgi:hypothetical protein
MPDWPASALAALSTRWPPSAAPKAHGTGTYTALLSAGSLPLWIALTSAA